MGAAKDIVEHVSVARFAFSDVPLGNSAGLPHDVDSQREVLDCALTLFEKAFAPRTTVQTPARWNGGDHTWKHDMMNREQLDPEAVAKAKAEFERQKELANLNR
ncbi:MAG: hypothetical protein ACI8TP_000830 [Acidimicrobiales bacterium]|jgi:hypothetical protein